MRNENVFFIPFFLVDHKYRHRMQTQLYTSLTLITLYFLFSSGNSPSMYNPHIHIVYIWLAYESLLSVIYFISLTVGRFPKCSLPLSCIKYELSSSFKTFQCWFLDREKFVGFNGLLGAKTKGWYHEAYFFTSLCRKHFSHFPPPSLQTPEIVNKGLFSVLNRQSCSCSNVLKILSSTKDAFY